MYLQQTQNGKRNTEWQGNGKEMCNGNERNQKLNHILRNHL